MNAPTTPAQRLLIGSKEVRKGFLFFAVEEGVANLGNFSRACSMIEAAALTGADAIEFQLLRAADFSVRHDPKYDFYQQLEFSDIQLAELVQHAAQSGLEFIAAALTDTLVEPMVRAGCSAFNINASDISNPRVLDAVAESGRPFFISLPMATEDEIDWAVARVLRRTRSGFVLMHGQHTMFKGRRGIGVDDTALGYIETLKRRYGCPVGFIDHTPHRWMPAAAAAAGAQVVTKHLALSRTDRGPDWEICLETDEMKEAVLWARQMTTSIHVTEKILAAGEDVDRLVMRKSVVAAKPLTKGHLIQSDDLAFKRPGSGIAPSQYEILLGRRLVRDLPMDKQVEPIDFEEA